MCQCFMNYDRYSIFLLPPKTVMNHFNISNKQCTTLDITHGEMCLHDSLSSNRVSPVYLMYRPANTVPYATVEAELKGTYLRYCFVDSAGQLVTRTTSEVEQKCSTFQHWIHQWTNGNLLVTQLEGKCMIPDHVSLVHL